MVNRYNCSAIAGIAIIFIIKELTLDWGQEVLFHYGHPAFSHSQLLYRMCQRLDLSIHGCFFFFNTSFFFIRHPFFLMAWVLWKMQINVYHQAKAHFKESLNKNVWVYDWTSVSSVEYLLWKSVSVVVGSYARYFSFQKALIFQVHHRYIF